LTIIIGVRAGQDAGVRKKRDDEIPCNPGGFRYSAARVESLYGPSAPRQASSLIAVAAVGAAIGVTVVGAFVIGALAIGRIAIRHGGSKGCVGELTVDRLIMREQSQES
jgi:hypothetical protein